MENLILYRIKLGEFKKIYFNYMVADFHESELAPYKDMKKLIKKNMLNFLVLVEESDKDKIFGYISYTNTSSLGYCLINHLAINKEYRNKGLGKVILEKVHNSAKGKAIVIEVEDPKFAKSLEDKTIMEKRIKFYKELGYEMVEGKYELFKMPMRLMLKNLTDECYKTEFTENKKVIMRELLLNLYTKFTLRNIIINKK